MPKFIIEPHFRLQEWVAEEKGYFRDEGLDHEFKEFIRASGGAHHVKHRQGRRLPVDREGARVQRHLRLPLDGERGGLPGPHQALRRRLFGRPLRHLRAGRLAR